MTQEHPITPPTELVQEWRERLFGCLGPAATVAVHELARLAAQWGADQELEACQQWVAEARNHGFGYDYGKILSDKLRAARRPKPPSLKEQALKLLSPPNGPVMLSTPEYRLTEPQVEILRRALESIPEQT